MTDKLIVELPIENIFPNPNQPRKSFSKSSLEELSNSIKECGLIQPITVRRISDARYELIAGERRLRACKMAGISSIASIVTSVSDESSAVSALIENIQRENLNFIEEAYAYQNLMNEYELTQKELSSRVGKSQSTIANKIRILRLPKDTIQTVIDGGLTERHARALLKLPDDGLRLSVLETIIKNDLTVKKAEQLISDILSDIANPPQEEKTEDPKKKSTRNIKGFINFKIYTNTLKNAYKAIVDTGIDAKYDEVDKGDHVEIVVRIPKL
ncbi:chromosome partitioning protein, ParB family [Peptoclostridium litorale DSM 5388]|uniref:Nucleoid occlusion protein Noc n=1 Tax=Peptoclostridium litorale DSM 5388 TaxID=1121324 RepID=A0A069RHU5_PEPLI|nr:nucleoid occlusion protein [Peptoclostridium litorale]KDR96373.1 nucleoid occlusion protein Noc [Peptoclostridium litorale DSM 5388]SIO27171.1 chromosome partitioning protein, ParB family [Peptoclostridium litorale DSM 5388]